MNQDAFVYVRNKIDKMSKLWSLNLKISFKEMILNGYKAKITLLREDDVDQQRSKPKKENIRGF